MPAFPRFDAERSLELFALTMVILLLPKIFGLLLSLIQGRRGAASGGAVRLVLSAAFEIIMSALLAPTMMLIQTGHVVHFVFGFDTGWDPQRRDDGSIPFMAIVRRHRSHVLMGILTLISGLLISPSLVAWMSPTIIGLILAILISWATGLLSVGLALRRIGLLTTPEEKTKPSVVVRANALIAEMGGASEEAGDGLALLYADPALRAAHLAFMPADLQRSRGTMTAEWALAHSKLADAETHRGGLRWLMPKERMAVLNDGNLLRMLLALPRSADKAA